MTDINIGQIGEALNNKVDIGYGNTSPKQPVTRQQISNCILEDPQNIKLELNNGTLTLKAGSVVCVPNGFESDGTTPKFDEVTTTQDYSSNFSAGNVQQGVMVCDTVRNDLGIYINGINAQSGTSPSTGGQADAIYYNTSTNKLLVTHDSGATWYEISFPICIANVESGYGYNEICSNFNSIGYIGSTVFVRKGLKVLIPDGRNADGSLKNSEETITRVQISSSDAGNSSVFYTLNPNNALGMDEPAYWEYDEVTNFNYGTYGGRNLRHQIVVARADRSSGKISNFKPYTAANILKYSDKSQISGWGMPSGRYVNLTLGASGATYTAPANGWFYVSTNNNATGNHFLYLYNGTAVVSNLSSYSMGTAGVVATAMMPVKKGATFSCAYFNNTIQYFKFFYAEGDK